MNRAVITTAITLGVLLLPLQAVAAERSAVKHSAGHFYKQQQDWQSHRIHRRDAIPHRNLYNHRVIKTDHRGVKRRVADYRLKHRRDHRRYAASPRENAKATKNDCPPDNVLSGRPSLPESRIKKSRIGNPFSSLNSSIS